MRNRVKEYEEYFNNLKEKFFELYEIASRARAKGVDPEPLIEIKPAKDLADRIEKLMNIRGLAKRIRELERSIDRVLVAFKVAEEIVEGKFGAFSNLEEKIEIAVRTGLAILTDGITAAPLQGIDRVKIKQNNDGTSYLAIYYAGPIRSAGGTEQALSVLLGDWIRQKAGLNRYKPTEEEIERYVEELRTYERYVTRFQYHATDDEVRYVIRQMPVEVTGVATDPVEVSIHRDLPRIETNCVRGGALRVINDGIIAKARKLKKVIDKLNIKGWEWIDKLIELRNSSENGNNNNTAKDRIIAEDKYLADLVAGRPVFSHPSRKEGFRIRYGRSRNTGLAAIGINPATMIIFNDFLAIGTQVRTERPGKSAIVVPVTTIEGPVVKLTDGSVIQVNDVEMAKRVKDYVKEIIFAGDVLVAYGEFKENNYPLVPSGYCEEWWAEELRSVIDKRYSESLLLYLDEELQEIMKLIEEPLHNKPNPVLAIKISEKFGIPLHPKFTYFWNFVSIDDVMSLRKELRKGRIELGDYGYVKAIHCKLTERTKRTLELLGVPHRVVNGEVVIEEHAPIIYRLFALNKEKVNINEAKSVRELLENLSGLKLRDKVTIGVGIRMGRPEKAAPRKMKPPVHALFPVGEYGGRTRDLILAMKHKIVVLDLNLRKCPKCGEITFEYKCSKCNVRTVKIRKCPKCGRETLNDICKICNEKTQTHSYQKVSLSRYVRQLVDRYGLGLPEVVKCVKGLINDNKEPEPLIKGILRAKYDLMVFKDGTIRFDATNAPLTHFKPKEIGISVEKLKELGYRYDYKGEPLERDDQIVELYVQDIIVPRACAEYLLKVAKFIDELLTKVYGMKPYYNAKRIEDLIGHLVIGLAPHTSAGILGRIIGFTDANVIYAHPYWHAAKRRNCDGDEDSVMLALDALLNFSRHYLPSKRGGVMDSPLVLTLTIDPREVDDEVHNMDVVDKYPLRFYELTERSPGPSEMKGLIEIVEDRLGKPEAYFELKFTHDTEDVNAGPKDTSYRLLKTMREKINAQLEIAKRLLAVDVNDVAERLLVRHLLPDLAGNLRAFSTQGIRCTKCNTVFRRPPLSERCPFCGGNLVLTIHQKSVVKYLNFIVEIAKKYKVSSYIKERVNVLERVLKWLFRDIEGKVVLDEYIKGGM